MTANMELVAQGAEARVYKSTFGQRPCAVKERFSKQYRHPLLDKKLTVQRTVQEARCMQRCAANNIPVPALYHVDTTLCKLYMGWIESAQTAKAALLAGEESGKSEALYTLVGRQAGHLIGQLHNINVVHGDLTTSNMLLRGNEMVLIDFGLSFVSALDEDKAVDLYVLERALHSTHPGAEVLFDNIVSSYKDVYKGWGSALKRLDEVRARGRKRSMIG